MKASEIMTSEPVCCLRTTGVMSAAVLLHKFDVGFLPVIDDWQTKRLVGIVTDRDCLAALADPARDVDLTTVGDCMATAVVTCTPEMDARRVLAEMVRHRVRRIPVVDQSNSVRGVVGISDLIHRRAIGERDLWMALSRITEPRAKEILAKAA